MVSPIDYILDTPDPLAKVLEGFQAGTAIRRQPELEQREATQFGQQQLLFEHGQEDRAATQAALAQQQADAKQMQADIAALNDNPNATAADYARIIATYPDISTGMQQSWKLLDSANQESTLLGLGEVYSAINSDNIELADSLLSDRVEALRNSGRTDEAAKTEAMLEILRASPDAAKTSIGLAIKTLGGTQFDSLLDTASTVQTSSILTDGTVVKVMRDGAVIVEDPSGNVVTGEDRARAIAEANAAKEEQIRAEAEAREGGKLETQIELAGTVAQVKALGALAVKLSGENLSSYNKVRTNIANYGLAIDALDRGANTGAIVQYFPSIKSASIELDNVRNRLGLDIIGAATFGALSKGELDLALSTGLPENMNEADTRDWLVRKRNAQEKLATELYKGAVFLATPGNTVQDYLGTLDQPTPPPPSNPNAEANAFFGGGS